MSTRISAHLDDITRKKLECLQAKTHKSVAELIAEALDLYVQQNREHTNVNNQALLDLAGCFEGPPELSQNYRDEISEILNEKYLHHR